MSLYYQNSRAHPGQLGAMFWKPEDEFTTSVFSLTSSSSLGEITDMALTEVSFLASTSEEEMSHQTPRGSPPELLKTCPDLPVSPT